jgi:DNA-binding NarL/FixJ family response regulator
MPDNTILVALVEDDARFADAIETLLNHTPGFRCESRHATGKAALEHLAKSHAHVVLVDLALPDMDGVEVIRRLRQVVPRIRPLVLSRFEDPDRVFAAACAGAFGYVLKAEVGRTLLEAITDVCNDRCSMSPAISRRAWEMLKHHGPGPVLPEEALTSRENDILVTLKNHPAWMNKEIGDHLEIKAGTVANYLTGIYRKLHIKNRYQLRHKK